MNFILKNIQENLCWRIKNSIKQNFIGRNSSFIIYHLSFIIILSSCTKEHMCDCFKGTGDVTSEFRDCGSFNSIEVYKNVELFLVQDSVYSVKVSAGSKLLSGITTENNNGTLVITNENKCNWVRSYKNTFVVEIHTPKLLHLVYESAADVTMLNTFKLDTLIADCFTGQGTMNLKMDCNTLQFGLHTGVADAVLSGNCGVNYLYFGGQGSVHAENLKCGYIFLNTKSTNDCYVNVEKELSATISYIGNVYYSGNPYKVDSIITGSGKLIPN